MDEVDISGGVISERGSVQAGGEDVVETDLKEEVLVEDEGTHADGELLQVRKGDAERSTGCSGGGMMLP